MYVGVWVCVCVCVCARVCVCVCVCVGVCVCIIHMHTSGLVPALDSIARHARLRSALADVFEKRARQPITGTNLQAVVHHVRSSGATTSCLRLYLSRYIWRL
jgi:hypothetical protein